MRIFELTEDIKWAVGKHSNQASNTTQHDLKNPENVVLWVDIRDLFANTEQAQRLDVDDPTGGENAKGGRISRAKQHWMSGEYMDPPLIAYNDYYDSLNFGDGRHRLVAAFQLGHRWAPIIADKESSRIIKQRVKTK